MKRYMVQRSCGVDIRRAEKKVPPIKGQSVRKLYFKESVRCLWKFSKKLSVQNTSRCAKGTAVNVPTEEAESLEKSLFG